MARYPYRHRADNDRAGSASSLPSYLIRQALDRAGRTSILLGPEREKLTAEWRLVMAQREPANLADALNNLVPKDKQPHL
ncbi:hypothetical protein UM93_00070 [Psychromicrobium lacuslunae]|uniref:Uncharacterized protein n=1 Tax=Psychromicrobium lacuslunae TaxID=1618207 RepID=A0A0D4BVL6_9MICC|nr:hypothetical protein UM93_00070 [Psychromicrobium lacuslunae]